MGVITIISGGQTGVDRAALDVALELGLPTGGWIPKGRLSEDGRIPDSYINLREATSSDYPVRTELNVRDSDATLILSNGPLTGGSRYTLDAAVRLGKPVRHVDLSGKSDSHIASEIRAWLSALKPNILNVAGPRASNDPGLGARVASVLRIVLAEVKSTQ